MKPSTKARLIPVLKTISTILEKCGGAGGTPGPCPTGGGGKPAKGPADLSAIALKHTKTAAYTPPGKEHLKEFHDSLISKARQAVSHAKSGNSAEAFKSHTELAELHRNAYLNTAMPSHGYAMTAHQKAATAHKKTMEST